MISNRAKDITSFMVMDILARAQELEKAGEHVIHLDALIQEKVHFQIFDFQGWYHIAHRE